MNDEGSQEREAEVGKRIAKLIRSIGQGPQKQITKEEVQKLKAAGDRLDRMLKTAADTDLQSLRDAAARLDRLLEHIGKGEDVVGNLKRPRERRSR